jgi:hypothetical protein
MQCFTVFRTFGASVRHHVKHAAHHLVGRHLHHHVIAHSVIGPVPIPAMVCILTGLAAVGVGALVAKGMSFAPPASKEVAPAVSTLAPNVPSEIGSLWASLSSFHPTEIGSLLVPASSFDWNELGSLPVAPSSFDWNELGSPPVPPSSFDWNEVDSLQDFPYSFDTSGPGSAPVPTGQPAAIREPTSISALAVSLLGLASLLQQKKGHLRTQTRPGWVRLSSRSASKPWFAFLVYAPDRRSSGKPVNAETV